MVSLRRERLSQPPKALLCPECRSWISRSSADSQSRWAIGYATAIAQAQADPNFAMGEYVSWTYLVKFRALSGFNAQFLEPDMLTDLGELATPS